MKKLALGIIVFLFVTSTLLLTGCFYTKKVDGIGIKNIDYKVSTGEYSAGVQYYNFTFSCTVKNTTNETLEFTVEYSAKFGGVFSNTTRYTEVVTLKSKQTKNLSYTREKTGNQVYAKSIKVLNVQSPTQS